MRTPFSPIVAVVTASLAVAACGSSSTPPPSNPPPVTTTASNAAPTSSAATPDAPPAAGLAAGSPAPALVATASDGTKIDLGAMKGKIVVVYFYPKDDTPGCTKEACGFRDAIEKLKKANVTVIGVSEDDDASHKAFTEKYKLNFSLVADKDGAIAKAFGVPLKDGYAMRWSFLVGADGKIKKVYPKVDPTAHADEILADAGAASAT